MISKHVASIVLGVVAGLGLLNMASAGGVLEELSKTKKFQELGTVSLSYIDKNAHTQHEDVGVKDMVALKNKQGVYRVTLSKFVAKTPMGGYLPEVGWKETTVNVKEMPDGKVELLDDQINSNNIFKTAFSSAGIDNFLTNFVMKEKSATTAPKAATPPTGH